MRCKSVAVANALASATKNELALLQSAIAAAVLARTPTVTSAQAPVSQVSTADFKLVVSSEGNLESAAKRPQVGTEHLPGSSPLNLSVNSILTPTMTSHISKAAISDQGQAQARYADLQQIIQSFSFPTSQDIEEINLNKLHEIQEKIASFLKMNQLQLHSFKEKISSLNDDIPTPGIGDVSPVNLKKQFHETKRLCLHNYQAMQTFLEDFQDKIFTFFSNITRLVANCETDAKHENLMQLQLFIQTHQKEYLSKLNQIGKVVTAYLEFISTQVISMRDLTCIYYLFLRTPVLVINKMDCQKIYPKQVRKWKN